MLLKIYTGDLDLKINAGFKFWKEHFHNIVAFWWDIESLRNNSEDNTLLMACFQVPAIPRGGGNGSYPVVWPCLIIDIARILFSFQQVSPGFPFMLALYQLIQWKLYLHFLNFYSNISNIIFYFLLVFAFLNSAIAVFTCADIKTPIWMRKYFPQQKCKCVLEALTFLSLSSNLTKVSPAYFVMLAQSIWLCLSNSVQEEDKACRKNIFSLYFKQCFALRHLLGCTCLSFVL